MIEIFSNDKHKNIMFSDLSVGNMIQSTQHLIVDGDDAILLDPGGHKVYAALIMKMVDTISSVANIKHIFFSHQDPDIIASANAWLMMTNAKAYLPEIWIRFITHFGVDDLVLKQITPIPDKGMDIIMNGKKFVAIPAHFLHSSGNFQLYDPESKILYSGDLGASFGQDYNIVESFENHIQYLEGFHTRYIATGELLKKWAKMIRKYDVDMIAPQHGAVMKGKDTIEKYLLWLEDLKCGIDLMDDNLVFKN